MTAQGRMTVQGRMTARGGTEHMASKCTTVLLVLSTTVLLRRVACYNLIPVLYNIHV